MSNGLYLIGHLACFYLFKQSEYFVSNIDILQVYYKYIPDKYVSI